jgi:cytoskeletal protein RodZ
MPDRRLELVPVDARPTPVRPERIGDFLRAAREGRAMPLEDVAHKTKIKLDYLKLLEESRVGDLPAEVFVGGFARAYATTVGASPAEATRLLAAEYAARRAPVAEPVRAGELAQGATAENSELDGRRRFGVVLVVVVILIAATLTLSLLLRRPSPAEGGLSLTTPTADRRTT